jgi:hypothetical protein
MSGKNLPIDDNAFDKDLPFKGFGPLTKFDDKIYPVSLTLASFVSSIKSIIDLLTATVDEENNDCNWI